MPAAASTRMANGPTVGAPVKGLRNFSIGMVSAAMASAGRDST
jgi:hypothetical protein